MGLSPRGRGNRAPGSRTPTRPRSIPAWAGKPVEALHRRRDAKVYPRVGGETRRSNSTPTSAEGLSPRGRGNLDAELGKVGIQGSIPAWAGKPPRQPGRRHVVKGLPAWAGKPKRLPSFTASCWVYPRVGGETYDRLKDEYSLTGLSPRGRGNHGEAGAQPHAGGSIPAWAGKPRSRSNRRSHCWVYPRVGGGNPLPPAPPLPKERSIPAWAGKPSPSLTG